MKEKKVVILLLAFFFTLTMMRFKEPGASTCYIMKSKGVKSAFDSFLPEK